MQKIGRNDPCPCGSGLKYKKCCLAKEAAAIPAVVSQTGQRMRQANGTLMEPMMQHMVHFYGDSAFAQAWDEFSNWEDVPISLEDYPELESAFPAWLLYNWIPENDDDYEDEFDFEDEYEDRENGDDEEDDESNRLPEITIAEHYLLSMGNRLSSFDRRFIEAARAEQFSYWQVLDCVPGHNVKLRDIMRGHELMVPDRYLSQNVNPGDVLFASIVTMDGESMVLGAAPYALPARCANELMDYREKIVCAQSEASEPLPGGLAVLNTELLFEYDFELRSYYWDVREMILNPVPPHMQNTDGEDLVPTTLHYHLSCSPAEAVTALAPLALEQPQALMEQGQTDDRGELVSIEFPWLKKGNAQHQDWNNTVLGHLSINGADLTVEVNSRERATSIKRRIAQRLKAQAKLVNTQTQSVEEMMAKHQADPRAQAASQQDMADNEALMAMPEIRAQMAEMAATHWKQWLDTSLPALNGQTPREAARTASGRERLEALLLDFSEKLQGDPLLDPDIAMLRRELKLQ